MGKARKNTKNEKNLSEFDLPAPQLTRSGGPERCEETVDHIGKYITKTNNEQEVGRFLEQFYRYVLIYSSHTAPAGRQRYTPDNELEDELLSPAGR